MTRLSIPPSWHRLLAKLERGTLLVLGAPGTGKTRLARYLVGQLDRPLDRVGLVDADVGQSSIGVPTCMGLALTGPWQAPADLWFTGDVSLRGNLLPTVVGAGELARRARQEGALAVVVDPGGMVAGPVGRIFQVHLAQAVGADQIIAIERRGELGPLLWALEAPGRRIHRLSPVPEAHDRGTQERRRHRQRRFEAHFRGAKVRRFGPAHLMTGDFQRAQLKELSTGVVLGLIDAAGSCLGLGVAQAVHEDHVAVLTPVRSVDQVHRLQVGDVTLDPSAWPTLEEIEEADEEESDRDDAS